MSESSVEFCHYPSHASPVRTSLVVMPDHPCPYLPDRMATHRALYASRILPRAYQEFMDHAFRRSGRMIYQPVCRGCRACVPLRVPVDRFKPSKSQRRCVRRNHDLHLEVGHPEPSREKHELYARYATQWHRQVAVPTEEEFLTFLYDSPVETIELSYRDGSGRLMAVGICDVSVEFLSSVYCYFDPTEASRGLGTFAAMKEIDWARSEGIPHYYLGYWVHGCREMEYKSSYRPCEILHPDGVWRSM